MKAKIFLLSIFFTHQAEALSSKDYPLVYDSYLLEKKAQLTKAIAKMTHLYKNNSEDYFVNLRLGKLFLKDQKSKIALNHFRQAAQINSNSLEPWLDMSEFFFNQKDWPQLELVCDEILKRDQSNISGQLKLIKALIEQTKYSKALEKIAIMSELYPLHEELLEFKAESQHKNGDLELAKKTLLELILINPENTFAKNALKEWGASP